MKFISYRALRKSILKIFCICPFDFHTNTFVNSFTFIGISEKASARGYCLKTLVDLLPCEVMALIERGVVPGWKTSSFILSLIGSVCKYYFNVEELGVVGNREILTNPFYPRSSVWNLCSGHVVASQPSQRGLRLRN